MILSILSCTLWCSELCNGWEFASCQIKVDLISDKFNACQIATEYQTYLSISDIFTSYASMIKFLFIILKLLLWQYCMFISSRFFWSDLHCPVAHNEVCRCSENLWWWLLLIALIARLHSHRRPLLYFKALLKWSPVLLTHNSISH